MARTVVRRGGFAAWLAASTVSTVGDGVSFFALGWVASAAGPGAASVVLTAESVPLCLLILVGGSLADRYGVRRVLVGCDVANVVVLTALAVASSFGTPLWLLAVAGALAGTAGALRRPADGVVPRLFSTGDDLARRMALVGGCAQAARVVGPTLGGVLVAAGGLPLASAVDAATFLVVLLVVLLVRPPHERDHVVSAADPGWRSVLDGARTARRTPGVPAMLAVIAGLAATLLPLMMLMVPLVGRARGWDAGAVGVVAAAWVAGGLVVTLVVARRGAPGRRVVGSGPFVAAAGVLTLAGTSSHLVAVGSVGLVGVGTVLLTAHLFPAFVAATPPDMLARFQSLAGLAQTGPVLVVMPVLGAVAARAGVVAGLLVVAAGLVVTGAVQVRVSAAGRPAARSRRGAPAAPRERAGARS